MADDRLPIRPIGPSIAYRDHAEEKILRILEGAEDRSSGCEELAAHIDDWPSRYHLSPLRSNLLRPFRFAPGQRILEIGAGTGVLTRHLAEAGVQVVALEGSAARAEAIAVRCAGLDNVEVVCGPLTAYENPNPFDVVLVVGVLEYAASEAGGRSTPERFLARIRQLLAAAGTLVLAIENQLGLKYLLGHPEDHLGVPWSGVAGYAGGSGIRTYGRTPLADLLATNGFPQQRWLYPFPDYKLPRVILDHGLYEHAHGPRLVDQLVRAPTPPAQAPPSRVADERACHRVFLEAGLGAEVANAFLVCAGSAEQNKEALVDPHALAWCISSARRPCWRRMKILRRGADGLEAVSISLASASPPTEGWLQHQPAGTANWVAGDTLELQVLAACHQGDEETVAALLRRWSRHLAAAAESASDTNDAAHPFHPPPGAPRLPGHYLDADLSNFILDGEDGLHYIDDEWRAEGGIDLGLACLRALWYLARDLVQAGAHHPWSDTVTIDALALELATAAGLEIDVETLPRFRAAEAALMSIIDGQDAGELEGFLGKLGTTTRASGEDHRIGQLRADVGHLRATRAQEKTIYEAEIERVGQLLAAAEQRAADAAQQAASQAQALAAIHRSKAWRLWMTSISLRRRLRGLFRRS